MIILLNLSESIEVEAKVDAEAKAEALIRFSWKQLLLPASVSMYIEALSRYMELILLSLLEKDIFEFDLEGCFENHNCQIWSKKISALIFSSLIILLNLSESMEVEAEADVEAEAEALIRFSSKQLLLPASASMQVF